MIHNFNRPAALLMGRGATGHWLQIELVGSASGRDAAGAEVTVRTAQGAQTRIVKLGCGYLSTSSSILHFGLGAETIVESIEVRWPSGQTERRADVDADQRLRWVEGSGTGPALRPDA
ncbi:MAG: ASPIC/UnbV domain-containing protein [Planctomycetes bacterium]|nr:ASPIC/UnbV domain-containing protein [Planctomycetota bacterium]